jgi:glycogen synthase
MAIKNVLITGEEGFLYRYRFLFEAMSKQVDKLQTLPGGDLYDSTSIQPLIKLINRVMYQISISTADRIFHKNPKAFIAKSRQTEAKISQLDYKPDLILHVFGMYCPVWDNQDISYSMYLDYTMALAIKNWSEWVPFKNTKEREDWLACERQAFQRACHLFTMSKITKNSLIEDYGIKPEKISVVGCSGNFNAPFDGEKTFGNQQILFNGSDFERKGGPLLLAAFKKVKQALPNSKLVIIGKKLRIQEDGVINLGKIASRAAVRDLFLETDLVAAPSYCDPFPAFLIEALNYGIPCLVPNKDGMPEIVDDGIDGIVVREMAPEVIADKIIEVLSDTSKLSSMSQQARHKIRTKLNWNDIASSMLHSLEN